MLTADAEDGKKHTITKSLKIKFRCETATGSQVLGQFYHLLNVLSS